MAWAAARPEDSNPKPESKVFASTMRSSAGETILFATATQASAPSAMIESKQNRASAKAACVLKPPRMFGFLDNLQASDSK